MGRERLLTNPPPSVQHPPRDVMQFGCTEGKIRRMWDFPGYAFQNKMWVQEPREALALTLFNRRAAAFPGGSSAIISGDPQEHNTASNARHVDSKRNI